MPPLAHPVSADELRLMRRVAARDEAASSDLFSAHRDGVYRLAYSLLGDEDEARDATQAAFLRAVGAAGKFDGRGPLRNWLLQIAVRETQRIRGRRRWSPLPADRPDARRPYAAIDAADALRRAMATLTPPLREAFALLYIEEMTIADAAALLDIPEGTVKSRAHAARTALRRTLGTP